MKKINFILIYACMIAFMILVFFANDFYDYLYLLVVAIIFNVIAKSRFKIYHLLFGLYISFFIFIFNIIIYSSFNYAAIKGVTSITIFIIILLFSYVIKVSLSHRQIAYCFSLGFIKGNQNKVYTVSLLVLNQINVLKEQALMTYKFSKIDMRNKKNNVQVIIQILVPFIFISLKRNTQVVISLMNKGYSIDNKKIKIVNLEVYNKYLNILLIVILIISILIVGVI